jgi:hypothetical protein
MCKRGSGTVNRFYQKDGRKKLQLLRSIMLPMIRRPKKIPVTGSRVIVTSSGAAVIILFVVMVLLDSMHWFYQKKMW